MSKLTEKEREGFERILQQDLHAINATFMNRIKDFWANSRTEVLRTNGWDKLINEKKELEIKKKEIIQRIHVIEETLNSEPLTPEQIVELGGKAEENGRFKGAAFYGIPVTSQFEYQIVEYIRNKINLEIPSKQIKDICEASIRELAMSGTFEEAREAYNKFYSLDFRRYGIDIPPRLTEILDNKLLIESTRKSLQIEDKN